MLGNSSDDPNTSRSDSKGTSHEQGLNASARTEASSSSVRASLSDVRSTVTNSMLEEIYRAVKLGMAPYEAMLIAGLNDEQIACLDEDPDFNKHIRFWQQWKNLDLLRNIDDARQLNLKTGNSLEARWLLSKLDRKHFGNGPLEVGGSDELPPVSFAAKDI